MESTLFLLLLFFVWFSSDFYNSGVYGGKLSKYDDVELEKELALLNKPGIKTIWTTRGEKYDCVYLNKNDLHASLKNHTFHHKITPSFYNNNNKKNNSREGASETREITFDNFWVNKKGCPIGTIPRQRTSKNDLIRLKQAAEMYANENELLTQKERGTHYAVVRTKPMPGSYFYGAGMKTSIYNPPVGHYTQYSSTQMRIQNGQDHIEVGWTVNPYIYPDYDTRMFVYSKAGESSCFNGFCGLFVPTSSHIPVNQKLTTSKKGGPIYELYVSISRELPDGDWILYLGPQKERIGHWPKNAFTELDDHATFIEWGGKVYSPPSIPSPPMGSGLDGFKYDSRIDSYCGLLTVIDLDNKANDVTDTITYVDVDPYDVDDLGIQEDKNFRHIMFYGGSGGITGN